MAFLTKGQLMATSGANGAVIWPFAGTNGPMGKEAIEVAHDEAALVVRVAGSPERPLLAAGLDDGRIWLADLTGSGQQRIKEEKGSAITALSLSPRGDELAWGDEDGAAGVVSLG